jgi:pyruvate/2-oxoglutarate dehydrogenase complex dihydrolipoamide acyltransferase (E2) component
MAGGLVAEWYQPDGASVHPGDPVCRIECSFVAIDVEAEESGLLRHRRPAGSIERPGIVLGLILAAGESMPPEAALNRAPAAAEDEKLAPPDLESGFEPADLAPGVPVEELEPDPLPEPDGFEAATVPGEPLQEFEEALVEAVVVPFPRRFSGSHSAWEAAPGDAVSFDSSLFGESEEERTEGLPVAGGDIPGLPLWEPDEASASRPIPNSAQERFARIADEAAASAQVLTMSVEFDCTELRKMRSVLIREWQAHDIIPQLDDLVLRAVALVLRERAFEGRTAGIEIAGPETDVACAINDPAASSLRQSVAARLSGGDAAIERADWTMTSFVALGISGAAPALSGGRELAFSLGAPDRHGFARLSLAYDSARRGQGSAARLLSRIRDILESPYAMLA